MPEALYQKYRPLKWSQVIGQDETKTILTNEIKRNELAHAYLFVGPHGVGKTTTARLLARSVNCLDRKKDSAEPCGKCESCERLNNQQSFDVIEIDAASHTGVDHVREYILESAQVSAGHGRFRVFIIDEVHMLSTAAFNAMLKILEEPPAHVIFILATTEAHKVPSTIISRCQRFDFKKVPASQILVKLTKINESENLKLSEAVLGEVVSRARGSVRDAESILGQVGFLGSSNDTNSKNSSLTLRDYAKSIVNLSMLGKTADALKIVEELSSVTSDFRFVLDECLVAVRDAVIGGDASQSIDLLLKSAEHLAQARRCLSDYPLPQMSLELAIVQIGKTVDKKID